MAPGGGTGKIFSATYSNVPVYEYNVNGNHVMRRRSDDWINATHILKVAEFDKPARTRILEREVQKGVHEKIQGGYGKYQGTWVPLHEGRDLAQRNGVLEKLRPIFDYVPGNESPPPAPKHTTAASNKPKIPKALAAPRRAPKSKPVPAPSQMSEDHYDNISTQLNDDDSPNNSPVFSGSEGDMLQTSQQSTASRKRKRISNHARAISVIDAQHLMYADELLDYFMLSAAAEGPMHGYIPPEPPVHFEVDRPIDDKGHTALHWGAAMGDIEVVKTLVARGANKAAMSDETETPLMRAVLFTNNFEKQTMPKLVHLLQDTIDVRDSYGSNVFHHLAATTSSLSKLKCARYYSETIINKLSEMRSSQDLVNILNTQDRAGDTALHIAAKNAARKCVRSFSGHGADGDIRNKKGVTANELIREFNARRTERYPQASSSPFQLDSKLNGQDIMLAESGNLSFMSNGGHSEAAMIVTSQIAPLISEKTEKLAAAFDKELEEKQADLSEALRLLENMERERHLIRQQTFALMTKEEDESVITAQREEYAALIRENESLLEQSQHAHLHSLVRAKESRISPPVYHTCGLGRNTEEEMREKLQLAYALHEEQVTRVALVKEVVQNMASAGMSEKGNDFKKLIASAIDVEEDEVENMIPDLLDELELSKMEDVRPQTPVNRVNKS
ncbi:MAG: hypothetical protein M1830_002071 [Pleopsidium flavum]|nr:MAG: hypothetical protein M1830_002071 [Pleopsidium flavum]